MGYPGRHPGYEDVPGVVQGLRLVREAEPPPRLAGARRPPRRAGRDAGPAVEPQQPPAVALAVDYTDAVGGGSTARRRSYSAWRSACSRGSARRRGRRGRGGRGGPRPRARWPLFAPLRSGRAPLPRCAGGLPVGGRGCPLCRPRPRLDGPTRVAPSYTSVLLVSPPTSPVLPGPSAFGPPRLAPRPPARAATPCGCGPCRARGRRPSPAGRAGTGTPGPSGRGPRGGGGSRAAPRRGRTRRGRRWPGPPHRAGGRRTPGRRSRAPASSASGGRAVGKSVNSHRHRSLSSSRAIRRKPTKRGGSPVVTPAEEDEAVPRRVASRSTTR